MHCPSIRACNTPVPSHSWIPACIGLRFVGPRCRHAAQPDPRPDQRPWFLPMSVSRAPNASCSVCPSSSALFTPVPRQQRLRPTPPLELYLPPFLPDRRLTPQDLLLLRDCCHFNLDALDSSLASAKETPGTVDRRSSHTASFITPSVFLGYPATPILLQGRFLSL